MIENFVEMLIENKVSKKEDKEIIIYGFITGIEIILNIITTIFLGFVFKLSIESLMFLCSYALIRIYAGGYHCEKAINCYICSSMIMIISLFIVKITSIKYILNICIILIFISIPIILKIAPIGTKNKPLDNEEKVYFKKKLFKNIFLEIIIFIIFIIFECYNLAYMICLGFFIVAIVVLIQYNI